MKQAGLQVNLSKLVEGLKIKFMRKIICLVILLHIINLETCYSQIFIKGHVSNLSKMPLVASKIYIENSYDETLSDSLGDFILSTDEKGEIVIVAEYKGYMDLKKKLTIGSETILCDFIFNQPMRELRNTRISIHKNKLQRDDSEMKRLSTLDIVTTVPDGNIFTGLKLQAGVQQIGESGELFTRGGMGNENKVYIDGMLVNNYLRSTSAGQSSTSRFSPNLFNNIQFNSGGYSSRYGQALSSVVDMELAEHPLRNNGNVSISPLFAAFDISLLNNKANGSISASVAYTNINGYTKLFSSNDPHQSFSNAPTTFENYLKIVKTSKKLGNIKFYTNYGNTSLTYIQDDIDNNSIKTRIKVNNSNLFSYLNVQNKVNGWKTNIGFTYSFNIDKYKIDTLYESGNSPILNSKVIEHNFEERISISKLIRKNVEINLGQNFQNSFIKSTTLNSIYLQNSLAAFYIENKIFVKDEIVIVPGIRYEYISIINRGNLSPRLQCIYAPNKTSIFSFNAGKYFQTPRNAYVFVNSRLTFEKSSMLNMSFQKSISERVLRSEIYYKKYTGLVTFDNNLISNKGLGYATGLDITYRDKSTIPGIDLTMTYSYINSKRKFLDYPTFATPDFIATNTASLVVKKYFSKLDFILTPSYTFATGRPYYNPINPSFLADKTKPYHMLNLNAIYLTKVRSAFTVIVLTVNNVLGTNQVYGYQYSSTNSDVRREIVPIFKTFIFIGAFLNFGIDNRQQIINDIK